MKTKQSKKRVELNESGLDYYMRILYSNSVHQKAVIDIPMMAINCLCIRYNINASTRERKLYFLKNIAMKEYRLVNIKSPFVNLIFIED